MSQVIIKEIDSKSIVWFKESNSYAIFEKLVAEIIAKINSKTPINVIEEYCIKKIDAPLDKIKEFIKDVNSIFNNNTSSNSRNQKVTFNKEAPKKYYSERIYNINNLFFLIRFETEYLELKIHPTFAHLEINLVKTPDFTYTFYNDNQEIVFLKNNNYIDKWKQQDSHVFEGKISMHILIDIYKRPERKWMGVFHASAVNYGNDSLLFLGDSGNGKSTSLALLNAHGYNCIADDFVPIDNEKNIRFYPAAISIKKSSVKTLLSYYPELEKNTEYHYKKHNKVVRFLPPTKLNYLQKSKCKALIFIKYDVNIELQIYPISKIEAFQQLIPDSWVSPLEENATIFLDWFLELPCYQLVYYDNLKMIETVSKIFNDEL
mgnify:CR=1 FL=1